MAIEFLPKDGTVAYADDAARAARHASTRPWILAGLNLSVPGSGLDVPVSNGSAWIAGYVIFTESESVAVPDDATSTVYLGLVRDGNGNVTSVTFTTSPHASGDYVVLGTATAASGNVSAVAEAGRSSVHPYGPVFEVFAAGQEPTSDLIREDVGSGGQTVGLYRFRGKNAVDAYRTYAQLYSRIYNPGDGLEEALFAFQTMVEGSIGDRMELRRGLTMAGAAGGDMGPGTVNATGLYVNGDPIAVEWGNIEGTLSDQTDLQNALDAKVGKTGNETVAGIKTFSSIPVLPASNPSSNNEAVRKAYVDSSFVDLASTQTVNGIKTFGSIPILPASNPTTANQAVRKSYVDNNFVGTSGDQSISGMLSVAGSPSSNNHVVTKAYFDGHVNSITPTVKIAENLTAGSSFADVITFDGLEGGHRYRLLLKAYVGIGINPGQGYMIRVSASNFVANSLFGQSNTITRNNPQVISGGWGSSHLPTTMQVINSTDEAMFMASLDVYMVFLNTSGSGRNVTVSLQRTGSSNVVNLYIVAELIRVFT